MDHMNDIGKRIREARGSMTQSAFAKALDISVSTLSNYELGKRQAPFDVMLRIQEFTGRAIAWLGTDVVVAAAPQAPRVPREVILLGFAECGLRNAWYDKDTLPVRVPLPLDYGDAEIAAVLAHGSSMVPDGIRNGNIVFCRMDAEPEPGDSVYIVRKDGKASLKLLLDCENNLLHTQGWGEPDPKTGYQRPFTDKTSMELIATLAPVALIKRKG
jgi:Predicted transcriptional regulators